MIQAGESGAPETHLDETELLAIAGLVLAAGFETTVNLLGNGIRMLLDTPENLDTLRQRPELWPNAVEEILRLESPVQLTARIALNDVEIAGMQIEAGELVVVYLGAANRDPSVFPDPHHFDIERPNAGKHLAFSGGRHFCLGPPLRGPRAKWGCVRSSSASPMRGLPAPEAGGTPGAAGLVDIAGDLGPARSMAPVES